MLAAFQKVTLLDYPDKVAAMAFTQGCNMACPYCHNFGLIEVKASDKTVDDGFFEYLDKRKGMLQAVVITGGEPTIHAGLADFIRKVKGYDLLVKLDTNGTNPKILKTLIKEGLIDYIAMDIKNSPTKYRETSGMSSDLMGNIKRSIELIKTSGLEYEFRTTIMKEFHTAQDIAEITRMIAPCDRYFLQNIRNNEENPNFFTPFSTEEMEKLLDQAKMLIPGAKAR